MLDRDRVKFCIDGLKIWRAASWAQCPVGRSTITYRKIEKQNKKKNKQSRLGIGLGHTRNEKEDRKKKKKLSVVSIG
jgi:hypothetical protein